MQSHKILITGANGLVGRITAECLASQGFQVFGLDVRDETQISPRFIMSEDTQNPMIMKKFPGKLFVADITEENQLNSVLEQMGIPDVIIHLAAALENQTPEVIHAVNVAGTKFYRFYKMTTNPLQKELHRKNLRKQRMSQSP
jgi:nucleoside-diphosphate-sugar epimerase